MVFFLTGASVPNMYFHLVEALTFSYKAIEYI